VDRSGWASTGEQLADGAEFAVPNLRDHPHVGVGSRHRIGNGDAIRLDRLLSVPLIVEVMWSPTSTGSENPFS
jgi:hypothetical protein